MNAADSNILLELASPRGRNGPLDHVLELVCLQCPTILYAHARELFANPGGRNLPGETTRGFDSVLRFLSFLRCLLARARTCVST